MAFGESISLYMVLCEYMVFGEFPCEPIWGWCFLQGISLITSSVSVDIGKLSISNAVNLDTHVSLKKKSYLGYYSSQVLNINSIIKRL